MIPQPTLQAIRFIRVRAVFEAMDTVNLPPYKGSAFRGCLGDALRRIACRKPAGICRKCRDVHTCSVALLYESPLPDNHPLKGKYNRSPHPYIIEPMPDTTMEFTAGQTFGFDVVLIGSAMQYLPLLVQGISVMGSLGIGKNRGHFRPVSLCKVMPDGQSLLLATFEQPEPLSLESLALPEVNGELGLQFETPLRIKIAGKLAQASDVGFALLANRLSERLALLAHLHCGAEWQMPVSLMDNGIATTGCRLQFFDWQRYSSTQDDHMNFGGLTGRVGFRGDFSAYLPMLLLGEQLHAGSNTTFGLGKYQIIT